MPVTKPNFDKPIIYGDIDKWGGKLNKIIDQQEAFNQEVVGSTTGIETDLARLEREKLSKSEANEIIENKVDNYIDANKKPELDAYTENLKLNNIKPYVDVKKTEINTHTETKKAELDSYVNTVNKVALNTHTETKKAELNTHNTVKKEELDTHTTTKKTELDTHTNTKKTELNTHVETVNKVSLNTHTEAKKVELNTHTTTKKTELDSYNAVKKNELDVFTEQEKTELDAHEKLKEAEITTHSNTEMELITGHANGEKLSIDVFTEAQKEELDAHEKLKEAELDSFNENQKLELVKKTDEEIERIKAVGIDGVLGEIEFNTGDNYVFERSENAENSIGMISRRKKYKLGELVDEIYIEKQNKNDNDLKTESKSIVGAINEIKVTIGSGGAIGSQVAQNKANVESLTSTKADKTEVNSLGSQVAQNKTDIENKVALKVDKTTKVVAGKGLVGGGDLSSDKELNIASVDEGIIVNDNDIKLNIVDDLITGGVKRPLSAEQGKVLKQLLDTIGTGGVTRLMRQAEMLSEYDYLGTLPSGGKSIATGKQLFDPSLYLNGIRIEPNKFSVGLTTGLITLNDVYSDAYDVIWLVEDKMPHHITFCFPTMNLLTANADMKNRIAIGDVIKILGESDADDGGHYLVKCEASAKLNAVDIGSGRFLNEIPNTRINEKVDKGGYNGTALDLHNESVKKSGDTMTGRLVVKELQISGIEPSLMNSVGSNLIRSSSSDANTTVVGNIKGKTIIDSLSNPTVRISSATTEQTIYHTGNKPSKADIGLGSVSDFPVTSSVSDSSNSKYATAGAVKQAYDRASSGINEANTKVSKAGDTMTGTLTSTSFVATQQHGLRFANLGGTTGGYIGSAPSVGIGFVNVKGNVWNFNVKDNGDGNFVGSVTATKFLGPLQGNSDTATKLATPRQINGTNFDGTGNITTANWGASRNLTVGATTKSVNGGSNVGFSLDEIGTWELRQKRLEDIKIYDLNELKTPGFYVCHNDRANVTNFPPSLNNLNGTSFAINVYSTHTTGSTAYVYQEFISLHGNTYSRMHSNGWGEWRQAYHQGFKPSKADVGLGDVNNWTATSAINDSSNSKYATAGAVKQAYDRASSGINEANTKVSKAGDTMTGVLSINSTPSATPLEIFRTNTDINCSIGFNTATINRYFGITNGVLRFGNAPDLSSSGYDVYHAGNKPVSLATYREVDQDNISKMDFYNIEFVTYQKLKTDYEDFGLITEDEFNEAKNYMKSINPNNPIFLIGEVNRPSVMNRYDEIKIKQ